MNTLSSTIQSSTKLLTSQTQSSAYGGSTKKPKKKPVKKMQSMQAKHNMQTEPGTIERWNMYEEDMKALYGNFHNYRWRVKLGQAIHQALLKEQ